MCFRPGISPDQHSISSNESNEYFISNWKNKQNEWVSINIFQKFLFLGFNKISL